MSLKSIEVEGKTIEAAIEEALAILHIPRNRVKIEILADGEQGLFGMAGGKPAKVRVTALLDPEEA